jgi:hypothetical protein
MGLLVEKFTPRLGFDRIQQWEQGRTVANPVKLRLGHRCRAAGRITATEREWAESIDSGVEAASGLRNEQQGNSSLEDSELGGIEKDETGAVIHL